MGNKPIVRCLLIALWMGSIACDDKDETDADVEAVDAVTDVTDGSTEETPVEDVTADTNAEAAGLCSGERFIAAVGDPISCCQAGNQVVQTLNGQRLAIREFASACSEEDGVSHDCDGQECIYGPCGARITMVVDAEEVHIFHPNSDPDVCGWAVINVTECVSGCDFAVGENHAEPESFDGQEEYPGVTATCTFANCADGAPIE